MNDNDRLEYYLSTMNTEQIKIHASLTETFKPKNIMEQCAIAWLSIMEKETVSRLAIMVKRQNKED